MRAKIRHYYVHIIPPAKLGEELKITNPITVVAGSTQTIVL